MVEIQPQTTIKPITLMGYEAGVCYNSNVGIEEKNYRRGIHCIETNHGRVLEFPQIYMTISGYSARMMRELYTHIAGAPTRVQASTRYIDYNDFKYITPPSIDSNIEAKTLYDEAMEEIRLCATRLEEMGIAKEDVANLYPLGMESTMVLRTNLRHLIDMSHQRMCTRAYWEYRKFMNELIKALDEYSWEWHNIVKMNVFKPKCELFGYCTEQKSCGRKEKKNEI